MQFKILLQNSSATQANQLPQFAERHLYTLVNLLMQSAGHVLASPAAQTRSPHFAVFAAQSLLQLALFSPGSHLPSPHSGPEPAVPQMVWPSCKTGVHLPQSLQSVELAQSAALVTPHPVPVVTTVHLPLRLHSSDFWHLHCGLVPQGSAAGAGFAPQGKKLDGSPFFS